MLALFLKKTKEGKALRALASNPEMAEIVGINIWRTRIIAFMIGSSLSGIAAVLISYDIGITPDVGLDAVLVATVAAILGGIGSIPGAAIAGLIMGLAESIGVWQISSKWQEAITFGILFLVIIFKPTGLFGRTAKSFRI